MIFPESITNQFIEHNSTKSEVSQYPSNDDQL